MVVGFSIVVAVFMGYRRMLSSNAHHLSVSHGEAKMSINKFHQVSTRNGIKEWILDAGSARYIDPAKQAVLEDISAIFFLKNNRTASLSADNGVLQTESSDIEVTGNVVVKNRDFSLTTESLRYSHGERLIRSRVPVRMTGRQFHFTAESMSFDLRSNRTTLSGNVEGTIGEGFKL